MVNKVFWNFVKRIIDVKKVDSKPCHYYEKNKHKVNKLYTKELQKTKHVPKK